MNDADLRNGAREVLQFAQCNIFFRKALGDSGRTIDLWMQFILREDGELSVCTAPVSVSRREIGCSASINRLRPPYLTRSSGQGREVPSNMIATSLKVAGLFASAVPDGHRGANCAAYSKSTTRLNVLGQEREEISRSQTERSGPDKRRSNATIFRNHLSYYHN